VQLRIVFLPGSVAAALASVALTVMWALYLPLINIGCTFPARYTPDVLQGEAFFEKPPTVRLAINRDGTYSIGSAMVRVTQLGEELRRARAGEPALPLEIDADGRLPTSKIVRALAAAQHAGYTEAYVFGHQHSLIEVAAAQAR
jgi:hypothetical protein